MAYKLHRGKDWIEDWKSNPIPAKSWDWIGFQSLFLPEIGIGIHSHFLGLANSLKIALLPLTTLEDKKRFPKSDEVVSLPIFGLLQ